MTKIILDTDLCGDCDDVAAVSLLNYYLQQKEAEILCITDCVNIKGGMSCIDGICSFYGNSNVEIGGYYGKNKIKAKSLYIDELNKKFIGTGKEKGAFPEAYKLMRKKLAQNTHVKIVCIGFLNNLALLLNSESDEISPLTGLELIERSVEEVIIMGGIIGDKSYFFGGKKYEREYNIVSDLVSSRKVFSMLTVPTTLVEFELGYNVLSFGPVVKKEKDGPLKTAFQCFGVEKRESWDPITIMYAVRGLNGLYKYSERGKIKISKDGKTCFQQDKNGNVRYLIETVSKRKISEALDSYPL